jgi:hypothetical protein
MTTPSFGLLPDHRAWKFSPNEELLLVFHPFSTSLHRNPLRFPVEDAINRFSSSSSTSNVINCVPISFNSNSVLLCSQTGHVVWFHHQQQNNKTIQGYAKISLEQPETIIAITPYIERASSSTESWHVIITSKSRILVIVLASDELIDTLQLHHLISTGTTTSTSNHDNTFLLTRLLGGGNSNSSGSRTDTNTNNNNEIDPIVHIVTRNGLIATLSHRGSVVVFGYDPSSDVSFSILVNQSVINPKSKSNEKLFGVITLAFHLGLTSSHHTITDECVILVSDHHGSLYRRDLLVTTNNKINTSEFIAVTPPLLEQIHHVFTLSYLDSKAVAAIVTKTSTSASGGNSTDDDEYHVFNCQIGNNTVWEPVFIFSTKLGWGITSWNGDAGFWNSDSMMDVIPFSLFQLKGISTNSVGNISSNNNKIYPPPSSSKKKRPESGQSSSNITHHQPPPSTSKKKPTTPITNKHLKQDEGWRVILMEALEMVIQGKGDADVAANAALHYVDVPLKAWDPNILLQGCLTLAREIGNRNPRPRWATSMGEEEARRKRNILGMDTIHAIKAQLLEKLVQIDFLLEVGLGSVIGNPSSSSSPPETDPISGLLELWEQIGFAHSLLEFAMKYPDVILRLVRLALQMRIDYGKSTDEFEKELDGKGWDITEEIFARISSIHLLLESLNDIHTSGDGGDEDNLFIQVNEIFIHTLAASRDFFSRKMSHTGSIIYPPSLLESTFVKDCVSHRLLHCEQFIKDHYNNYSVVMMCSNQMKDMSELMLWSSLQVRDLLENDTQAEQYIIARNTNFIYPLVRLAEELPMTKPFLDENDHILVINNMARYLAELGSDFDSLLRCCTHLQNIGYAKANNILDEYALRYRYSMLKFHNNFLVCNENDEWKIAFQNINPDGSGGQMIAKYQTGDVFAVERFPNLSDELVVIKRFDSLIVDGGKSWILFHGDDETSMSGNNNAGVWSLLPITSREEEREPPPEAFFFRVNSGSNNHDGNASFHLIPARRGSIHTLCFQFSSLTNSTLLQDNNKKQECLINTVIMNPSDWIEFPREALKYVFIRADDDSLNNNNNQNKSELFTRAFELAHRCKLENELVQVLDECITVQGDVSKRNLSWIAKLGAHQYMAASADLKQLSIEQDKSDVVDHVRVTHAIGLLSARCAMLSNSGNQQMIEKLEEFHRNHGEPWKQVILMGIPPTSKKHDVIDMLTDPSRYTTTGVGVEVAEAFDLAMFLVLGRKAFASTMALGEQRLLVYNIMSRAFVVEFKLWSRWLSWIAATTTITTSSAPVVPAGNNSSGSGSGSGSDSTSLAVIVEEVDNHTISKKLVENYCTSSNIFDVEEFFKTGGVFETIMKSYVLVGGGEEDNNSISFFNGLKGLIKKMVFGGGG